MKKWENPKIECICISLTEGGISPLLEFDTEFKAYCTKSGCTWFGWYNNTDDVPKTCPLCGGKVKGQCVTICRPS